MDAFTLLKRQHREVAALFEKFENSDDDDTKQELFEQIADQLAIHTQIEEKYFYPACRAKSTQEDLAEAWDEHKEVKQLLVHALDSVDNPGFDGLVAAIKGGVEHHVDEEENELFPKVKKLLDKDELADIGDKMNALAESLLKKGNARNLLSKPAARAPARSATSSTSSASKTTTKAREKEKV